MSVFKTGFDESGPVAEGAEGGKEGTEGGAGEDDGAEIE
eukprot:CAMPEP_0119334764 /NCGR_PEP_ID=MMETSP1333-20130426/88046_1 /TAXON_ID=418940 /ORGANISM="Scyphosphaera apsteinii, Strain RCC1455" /LENGTH=38 /DNA_ID= /DNA_START= /DNA_END= /DNA_ORIENTATION=